MEITESERLQVLNLANQYPHQEWLIAAGLCAVTTINQSWMDRLNNQS